MCVEYQKTQKRWYGARRQRRTALNSNTTTVSVIKPFKSKVQSFWSWSRWIGLFVMSRRRASQRVVNIMYILYLNHTSCTTCTVTSFCFKVRTLSMTEVPCSWSPFESVFVWAIHCISNTQKLIQNKDPFDSREALSLARFQERSQWLGYFSLTLFFEESLSGNNIGKCGAFVCPWSCHTQTMWLTSRYIHRIHSWYHTQ